MVLIVPRTPPKGGQKRENFSVPDFSPENPLSCRDVLSACGKTEPLPLSFRLRPPDFLFRARFPIRKAPSGQSRRGFLCVYLFPFLREPVSSFFRFCRIFFPLWPSALCSFFFVGLYIPGVTTFLVLFPCRTRRTSPFSS